VLAAVLALVAVAGVVMSVVLMLGSSNAAADEQSQREAVMAQTEQFMKRMGTYGPELLDDRGQMPTYRERVREVITPKFAASFDKEAGTAEQLVAQAGVSRTVSVFAAAVSSLDADSARALVAGSFAESYAVPSQRKGGKTRDVQREPVPFRLEVDLVKIEGEWLVDDFAPVQGGADDQPETQPDSQPDTGQPTPSGGDR